jgi:hypothetical protein
VQGGGIQPGYEAKLSFNGKTYPKNPSVPPAQRLTQQAVGKVVVPVTVREKLTSWGYLHWKRTTPIVMAGEQIQIKAKHESWPETWLSGRHGKIKEGHSHRGIVEALYAVFAIEGIWAEWGQSGRALYFPVWHPYPKIWNCLGHHRNSVRQIF